VRPLCPPNLVSVHEVLQYLREDCYLDKAESPKYLGVSVGTFEGWMDQLPQCWPGGRSPFKKSTWIRL
jgi:hypothetical protein